jgi:glycosyltransferase involved in cell wall biosynthesis
MADSVKPKVSVIIPAYNAAEFVAEAVQSILVQTFADFELIIIEDGSTDRTRAILKSFTDERVIVGENLANLGEAESFNIGMALARGDFLARFDADDIAESNRLELQYEFMMAHPEVTVCGADMSSFGEIVAVTAVPLHDGDIKANFMLAKANIMNPTAFVRRQFVIEHRIRMHPGYTSGDDLAFWIDCMRHGAVFANIDKPLIRYRTRPRNRGGQPDPTVREILTRLALDFFPSLSHTEAKALIRIFSVASANLNFGEISQTVTASEKALADNRCYFGENRIVLRNLVVAHLQMFIQAATASIREK